VISSRTLPWWRDDEQYADAEPIPAMLVEFDPEVVRANPDGTTQPGWGAADYLSNRDHFMLERHDLARPFGIVMRSLPALCVDIDGKNGGTTSETERALMDLGLGPTPTLAEQSRSGDGYHLFYAVADEWSTDPARPGFASFPDRIGLLMGVDIKAVTLVFHHPHQHWNALPVADLPEAFASLLSTHRRRHADSALPGSPQARLSALRSLARLRWPVEDGSRNTTLWGIAKDLYRGDFPDWENVIAWAADQCGLSDREAATLLGSARQAVDREYT
jgi:hypothetical protein